MFQHSTLCFLAVAITLCTFILGATADDAASCLSGDISCISPSVFSELSLEEDREAVSLLQRQAVQLTGNGVVAESSGKSSAVAKESTLWDTYVDFMTAKVNARTPLSQEEEDTMHEVFDGQDRAAGHPWDSFVARGKGVHVEKYREGLTIPIHPWKLIIVAIIVFLSAWAVNYLRIGIGEQLLIAALRLSIQMCVLGYMLYPLFLQDNVYIVLGYILLFMLFIASWEAASRPKLMYPGMLMNATLSILLGLVSSIAVLTFVVAPTPWYSARYTVPLSGMLVQFSLTGVAPALNMLTEFMASRKEHVEVLLSLGATPYEACWPCFTQTVRQALIPSINSMNVAGLVTIPGMMAGQIIGGAMPQNAALYQITILTIGSVCAVIAVTTVCLLSFRSLFDERSRLVSSRITKQSRSNFVSTIAWYVWFPNWCSEQTPVQKPKKPVSKTGSGKEKEGLIFKNAQPFANSSAPALLDLDISGVIANTNPIRVRLSVHEKEVACIMGPSGIGKSTILKMTNDLQSQGADSEMTLRGRSVKDFSPQEWRRDVMYIHQSKAPLPGSPADLLEDVKKFKINQGRPAPEPVKIMEQLGLSGDFLQRPWAELSGGEAQRVTCAITLAMQPTILLLDEPSSGLDDDSKKKFEKVLAESNCTSILVTHDEQQAARVGSSLWKVGHGDSEKPHRKE